MSQHAPRRTTARRRVIVAGTDTGVGKTVFAAALAGALDAFYWKPVQAGCGADVASRPLTPTLSPEGRGGCAAPDTTGAAATDAATTDAAATDAATTDAATAPRTIPAFFPDERGRFASPLEGEAGAAGGTEDHVPPIVPRRVRGLAAGADVASCPLTPALSPEGRGGCAAPDETDRETVLRLSGLPAERLLPEAYRLRLPAAPAIAAAAEGLALDPVRLARVPEVPPGGTLVIETAGGLLVPISDTLLQIDVMRSWIADATATEANLGLDAEAAPAGALEGRERPAERCCEAGSGVVLVARTALGTINHTLLSLEAARARGLPVLGIAFVGEAEPEAEAAIVRHGDVRRLGRLPRLDPLDAATLAAAFAANFRLEDFR